MSKASGCKTFLGAIGALGLSVLAAAQSYAGYTTMCAPYPGEASDCQILSNSYGGNFVAKGDNYTNGKITAKRVDDSKDITFSGNIECIDVLGAFAGQSQKLGYLCGCGQIHNLVTVGGSGYSVTGGCGAIDMPKSYEFVRYGSGDTFYSDPTQNCDGQDHLVTYLLQGKGIKTKTYVLCWEDLSKQNNSDFDFNDMVVCVKTCDPAAVPLPAGVWTGLSTMLGAGLAAGVRKARRQMA